MKLLKNSIPCLFLSLSIFFSSSRCRMPPNDPDLESVSEIHADLGSTTVYFTINWSKTLKTWHFSALFRAIKVFEFYVIFSIKQARVVDSVSFWTDPDPVLGLLPNFDPNPRGKNKRKSGTKVMRDVQITSPPGKVPNEKAGS